MILKEFQGSSSQRAFHLDQTEYITRIIKPIIKLYASPDRGTRMALLDSLPEYEGRLDARMVQDAIWPHLVRDAIYKVPCI